MAKGVRVTKNDKAKFINVLRVHGNVSAAAESSRHHRQVWYRLKENDDEFSKDWDDARRSYLDDVEEKVLNWAVNGYVEASSEQIVDEEGKQVGLTKRKSKKIFDPRLAMRVLERRHPDYKPSADVDLDSESGVLVVPGIAPSEEAWLKQFGATSEQ